ncbi:DNA-binding protein [Paenibacillus anaericanus]|uniref:DNA-binding protein n=1 Tax=Paenibacillus anaericanus TaxID=170367 RepID=A0A433XX73_9BACL|nr:helix-turn-helix domain-containing protein [Paenibacillus anaericanus]RUT39408.1 DNA-binding protein [Paenibacillus anaericanus]
MVLRDRDICYTVSDLYEMLPLGRNAIYKLVNSEDFPKKRIGNRILIPALGFARWLENFDGNDGEDINI